MSKTVIITSAAHFDEVLGKSKIVVTDYYADWCGPCKAVAPIFETLSQQLSKAGKMTFTKVDTDVQKEIAAKYSIRSLPTFMIFKDGKEAEKVVGTNVKKLQEVVRKLAAEADGSSSFSSGSGSSISWGKAALPRGYSDVTDQVEIKGLDLLNSDTSKGAVRTLFDNSTPSALSKGKKSEGATADWIESDTDEQLMLFMPFQSSLKIHTLMITSLPPASSEDDDEIPMRPKTIKLYSNRPHILGFEEADDIPATQEITLESRDWDEDGTAAIPLRFVKFQNATSLVMFVVDGDGDGERTRIDRLRIVGDTGEKREMGKLEKIGDEPGE